MTLTSHNKSIDVSFVTAVIKEPSITKTLKLFTSADVASSLLLDLLWAVFN